MTTTEFNLSNFTASLWVCLDGSKPQTIFAKGSTGLTIGTNSSGKTSASIYRSDCTTKISGCYPPF